LRTLGRVLLRLGIVALRLRGSLSDVTPTRGIWLSLPIFARTLRWLYDWTSWRFNRLLDYVVF
jgi:hypothetical protein